MDNDQFWQLSFITLCSIRFHPRNEITDEDCEILYCADIADRMLEEKLCRDGLRSVTLRS